MADYKRHPAEVTSDRLAAHVERWHDRSTPEQRDTIAAVRAWLQDVADEDLAKDTS